MIHTRTTIDSFRTDFFAHIEKAEKIVITAHYSPDDDSIASVLSAYTVLTKKYPHKDIRIIYTGEPVLRYNIFTNFDAIQFVADVAEHLEDVDILFQLDAGSYNRVSKKPEFIGAVPVRVCIDHHASTPDDWTLALIDPNATSNAELVYNVFEHDQTLDTPLCELYLLGILGDTGMLTYVDRSESQVFSLVQHLVEVSGIRIDSFFSRYRTIPKRIIPLLQEYVKNTTFKTMEGWPSTQYSFVDRSFVDTEGFSDEDMSAASHIYLSQYLPRIEAQPWGFVLSPRSDKGMRMSSRSIAGSVNVRIFHELLGVGGGHDRAAGANFAPEYDTPLTVEDCLQKVFKFMETHTPVLG